MTQVRLMCPRRVPVSQFMQVHTVGLLNAILYANEIYITGIWPGEGMVIIIRIFNISFAITKSTCMSH